MQFNCPYLGNEFKNLFERYLYSLDHPGTANECIRSVRSICNFTQKDFLDLTKSDVDSYVLNEINVKKLKQRTVSTRIYRCITLARHIDRVIPDYGMADVFTSIRMPIVTLDEATEKIREKLVTRRDFDRLLSAAESCRDEMAVLIFSLAYLSALYASEVCGLRSDQVFIQGDGTVGLYLYNESYHSERSVALDAGLGSRLLEYMEKPKRKASPFVFLNKYGNPLTLRNLSSLFRKYCRECGLGEEIAFRDLRTSCVVGMFGSESAAAVGEKANLRDVRLNHYSTAYRSMGPHCTE